MMLYGVWVSITRVQVALSRHCSCSWVCHVMRLMRGTILGTGCACASTTIIISFLDGHCGISLYTRHAMYAGGGADGPAGPGTRRGPDDINMMSQFGKPPGADMMDTTRGVADVRHCVSGPIHVCGVHSGVEVALVGASGRRWCLVMLYGV